MNHDDYATFEMAQALKSAGFDYPCYELWDFNFADDHSPVKVRRLKDAPRTTVMRCSNSELESYGVEAISAPTLAIAQKWLREVHELSIEPICNMVCEWNVNVCNMAMFSETIWSKIGLNTYESALAAGISAALELITKDASH